MRTHCTLMLALLTMAALAATSCAPASDPALGSPPTVSVTEVPSVAGARATAMPAPPALSTATLGTLDLQAVKPNELGNIPILEYHVIANAEEDQWTMTPDHFRRDLRALYDAGFRPISMADYLSGRIEIPAGTSPVLLTFDDSSPGQFRYLEEGGRVVVDPDSAVGMLEAFHTENPDWSLKGIFYVLPEAAQPHKLFGQPQYEAQKLRYLVSRGFEIGNHTYWHQRLDEVDDQEVQRQLALAVREIQDAVPGYQVRSLSLPLGMWPANPSLALDGSYQGVTYHNDSVVLVGSEPAPSPFRSDFDPQALQRVQSFDDNLTRWIDYLGSHPDERYVSDGDPNTVSFPSRLQSSLSSRATRNMNVRSY